MIKRSFFGLAKPKVEYDALGTLSATEVAFPAKVTLLADTPCDKADAIAVKAGDVVKAGQKIQPVATSSAYVVATAGGTVSAVTPHTGNFGRKYTAVTIATDANAEKDGAFQAAGKEATTAILNEFLRALPGGLPAELLSAADQVKTIVICGADDDLLCVTRQAVIKDDMDAVKSGVAVLKKIAPSANVILAATGALASAASTAGVDVKSIGAAYPAANPRMIAASLGKTVPAGASFATAGFCFISAEAVAALGKAFADGVIPSKKLVTVVSKTGDKKLVSALLGTPVGDVLAACACAVDTHDRIVLGGPMTGTAIYAETHPVGPDTDMIMVQAAAEIPFISGDACINCGECVRMCPANIPVNMLIRYLEVGQYSDAVDNCDLLSCIECGLCGFVCPAHIPIFQYITLGKYEFARQNIAEADNA